MHLCRMLETKKKLSKEIKKHNFKRFFWEKDLFKKILRKIDIKCHLQPDDVHFLWTNSFDLRAFTASSLNL